MLKKMLLILCVMFVLTGCKDKDDSLINDNIDQQYQDVSDNDEDFIDNIYVDDNPIKVSLYDGSNKITSYNTSLANFKDIGVFDVIYTDVNVLDSSNTKHNYQKYYDTYENIDEYKTGFFISFEADGKTIEELVLDPSSQHNMAPYLYIYLYDDVNQKDGTYYSHLEMDDYNNNSIISSVKLFFAEAGVKISSPITFTVFTYNEEEDFDEFNRYRGVSSYTVLIDVK